MAKLKLVPDPTFKAKVPIAIAGGPAVDVEFTFKHRTRTALEEFVKAQEGKPWTDTIMDCVTAWDLDEPFTKANVETLLENYMGSGPNIYLAYMEELAQAKQKN